jgi:hypothetical protein
LKGALEIVKEYELKTTTKFTVYKRSENFGSAGKFTHVIWKFNLLCNLKTVNKKNYFRNFIKADCDENVLSLESTRN